MHIVDLVTELQKMQRWADIFKNASDVATAVSGLEEKKSNLKKACDQLVVEKKKQQEEFEKVKTSVEALKKCLEKEQNIFEKKSKEVIENAEKEAKQIIDNANEEKQKIEKLANSKKKLADEADSIAKANEFAKKELADTEQKLEQAKEKLQKILNIGG